MHSLRGWTLAALLAAVVAVGLLPATAFAASPTELWVNGTDIITDADHVVECGEGTAIYDPDSNTLTLNNAVVTQDHSSSGIYADGDLNIVLEGENDISSFWSCIQAQNGNVSISGTGSLTIDESTGYGIWANHANIAISADVEKLSISAEVAALQAEGGSVTIGDKPHLSYDKKITILKGTIVNLPPELVVNGVDILSAPDFSVSCGEGTATYDPLSNTLTLDNVNIDYSEQNPDYNSTGAIVFNGDLNIQLIGNNSITSNCAAINGKNSGTLTVTGDELTIDSQYSGILREQSGGNITVDGAELTINVGNTAFVDIGIKAGGELKIINGSVVDARNVEDMPLVGNFDVVISDSTVLADIMASEVYNGGAITSNSGGVTIQNSIVDAKSNPGNTNPTIVAITDITISDGSDVSFYSDAGNAVISYDGRISITSGSKVEIISTAKGYPALVSTDDVEILDSSAVVQSNDTIGIWSTAGSVTIQDSIAQISAGEEWDAIRGDNGGVTVSGSWIEVLGSMVSKDLTSSNNVVFLNNEGSATGSITLPGDVTVSEDMHLSVPEGSTIEVPDGVTFTNHGQVDLMGELVVSGSGIVVCDSHVGGTATCTSKAVCDICKQEYGNLASHNLVKIDAVDPTCTEPGNTEYWTCSVCEKVFSDATGEHEIDPGSTVIPATDHSYGDDGHCTKCGAVDPDFVPEIIAGAYATWHKGSGKDLSFTSNAAHDDFLKVLVDGKELDVSNYAVEPGSTVVSLKASYLETLSAGKHELGIVSDTGTAKTEFTVVADEQQASNSEATENDSNNEDLLASTGDGSAPLIAVLSFIALISAAFVIGALRRFRLK